MYLGWRRRMALELLGNSSGGTHFCCAASQTVPYAHGTGYPSPSRPSHSTRLPPERGPERRNEVFSAIIGVGGGSGTGVARGEKLPSEIEGATSCGRRNAVFNAIVGGPCCGATLPAGMEGTSRWKGFLVGPNLFSNSSRVLGNLSCSLGVPACTQHVEPEGRSTVVLLIGARGGPLVPPLLTTQT